MAATRSCDAGGIPDVGRSRRSCAVVLGRSLAQNIVARSEAHIFLSGTDEAVRECADRFIMPRRCDSLTLDEVLVQLHVTLGLNVASVPSGLPNQSHACRS